MLALASLVHFPVQFQSWSIRFFLLGIAPIIIIIIINIAAADGRRTRDFQLSDVSTAAKEEEDEIGFG